MNTHTPTPGYALGATQIIRADVTAQLARQQMPADQRLEVPQPAREHPVNARPQRRPRRPEPVTQAPRQPMADGRDWISIAISGAALIVAALSLLIAVTWRTA